MMLEQLVCAVFDTGQVAHKVPKSGVRVGYRVACISQRQGVFPILGEVIRTFYSKYRIRTHSYLYLYTLLLFLLRAVLLQH